MATDGVESNRLVVKLVDGLRAALGERLVSVVVFGSAARGDAVPGTSDINLMLVLADLEPATLGAAAPAIQSWLRSGQPMPTLFSRTTLAESVDVFPIEFLEIAEHRVVVTGDDPLAALEVSAGDLRLQCERELREKLMRLRAGYISGHGSKRGFNRLLVESFPSFAAILRGALRLLGERPPASSQEVIAAFCDRTGLDRGPFDAVAELRRGERRSADLVAVFTAYYEQLMRTVEAIDRFTPPPDGGSR